MTHHPAMAGRTNDVWSSSDGSHWVQETASAAFTPRFAHQLVVFDNKLMLIAGDAGTAAEMSEGSNDVWLSNNGIDWRKGFRGVFQFK